MVTQSSFGIQENTAPILCWITTLAGLMLIHFEISNDPTSSLGYASAVGVQLKGEVCLHKNTQRW